MIPDNYQTWLRTVCFQQPTKEAEDLAKCAWQEAQRLAYLDCIRICKERFEDEANACVWIIKSRMLECT